LCAPERVSLSKESLLISRKGGGGERADGWLTGRTGIGNKVEEGGGNRWMDGGLSLFTWKR
jgi:hypothetical protein